MFDLQQQIMRTLSISQFNPLLPVYYWSWVMEGINPFNLKPKDPNATKAYRRHTLAQAQPPINYLELLLQPLRVMCSYVGGGRGVGGSKSCATSELSHQ